MWGAVAAWLCAAAALHAQWTPVTADTSPVGQNVGVYSSLAVVNGNPAISYYDIQNQDLKYVRATNATGSTWGTPVTVYDPGRVGEYNSLCVVNGVPSIAFYNWDFNSLNFVSALDANGTTWGWPNSVNTIGADGWFTSMAIVNGNPAISYHDGDLRYVRATNASGTAWGAPVAIDTAGSTGYETSLAIVNGNPAIAYFDFTNQNLKYVRATNATGALVGDWGAPIAIETTGDVGQFPSLAEVNGSPAIAYADLSNARLKYVRATNATGALLADWGTPIVLDSSTFSGLTLSLAVVNGSPAVSYYDPVNSRLKYIEALNSTGALLTDWGTPVVVDTGGGVDSSLRVVNGNAAVSYYDSVNDDLKFAYRMVVVNKSADWEVYE